MRRKHVLSLFMLSMGVALLVAAMVAGVASSANRSASHTQKSLKGGTEKIAIFGDFDQLDPQIAYNTLDWTALTATDLTLVGYPDSNRNGTPLQLQGAASFPTISKNGRTYVWHIRKGQRFNDGSKVTAASFKRAIERNLSPKMYGGGVGVADFFQKTFVGGVAFNAGHAKHISGVKAKGLTLTLHLTRPTPYMTAAMAMIWFSGMKPNTPYDNNSSANGAAKWYPSAGPYYIAARNIATGVTVLKRNKFYHGPKAANPDQIKFIAYSDQSTAINDTKAGVVNVDMAGWPGALAGQLKQEFGAHTVSGAHGATKGAGGQLHFEQTDCIDFFTFNTAKAPTNNVNVRKALEFGLDRTGALSILGAGAGTTADQILTPPVPGYHHFTIYTRRPNFAKAKQVGGSALANAGTFQFWHSTSGTRTRQAAFLENDLRALGLKYQDDIIQPTTYYEQLGHRGTTYNIARAGWCADYYDPFDYLNVLFDGNSIVAELNNDLSYIDSPALNKQLEKAATIGGAKRNKVYGNLDREIMAKYAPYFPYELDYARMLTSKNMHNWTYDAFQGSPAINALAVG